MSLNKHIVMFPFMAHDHFNPFLSLAQLISQRHPSFNITLLSTPLNIKHLQSLRLPSNIHLKSLPFDSSDHGLPPSSENTSALSMSQICTLLHASESLQPHFQQAVHEFTEHHKQPPLCIIADVFLGWTVETARKLGIFHAAFSTCGAYGTAIYFSMWLQLPHVRNESSEFINITGFPEKLRLHRSQLSRIMLRADGTDPWSSFFRRQFSNCVRSNAMVCNTVEELQPLGLELLRRSFGLRQWTFWSLPRDNRTKKKPALEVEHFVEWLDSHPNGSVVYVSFGSQNSISAPAKMELASGLEGSGKAFIWVVRPPIEFDMNEDFRHDEWLPRGFEERVTERMQGLVVRKWAPQVEILSHKAVGAFLSHCGWNSVLESLSSGVPTIGWPLAGEQTFNSKMLVEELGVCVEVARGGRDEKVSSGETERVIRLVMGDGERAKELKAKRQLVAREF